MRLQGARNSGTNQGAMTLRLIECIPNVSAARDLDALEAICSAATRHGATLLDRHIGGPANRSVLTLVGEPAQIEQAAFDLIAESVARIDMTTHRGNHPRLGACDVCPFVPLTGVTRDECVDISKRVAKRVASELKLPVYLYEHSASAPERSALPDIRRGEFEGLQAKMLLPQWQPDFGPNVPHASAGAVIIGARDLLVAFNIALHSASLEVAQLIAQALRSRSRSALRLEAVRAIGWYHDEFRCAQVSMNLLDFRITSPERAYKAVAALAKEYGAQAGVSELVGMIPLAALIPRARPGSQLLDKFAAELDGAAARCGLGVQSSASLAAFNSHKKTLELRLKSMFSQWNSVL